MSTKNIEPVYYVMNEDTFEDFENIEAAGEYLVTQTLPSKLLKVIADFTPNPGDN